MKNVIYEVQILYILWSLCKLSPIDVCSVLLCLKKLEILVVLKFCLSDKFSLTYSEGDVTKLGRKEKILLDID